MLCLYWVPNKVAGEYLPCRWSPTIVYSTLTPTSTRHFPARYCCSLDIWFCSLVGTVLCKPLRWLWCCENRSRSAAVCKTLRAACLPPTTMTTAFKDTSIPSFGRPLWTSANVFTTSTRLNAQRCCHVIGWLAICVNKKVNPGWKCICLTF